VISPTTRRLIRPALCLVGSVVLLILGITAIQPAASPWLSSGTGSRAETATAASGATPADRRDRTGQTPESPPEVPITRNATSSPRPADEPPAPTRVALPSLDIVLPVRPVGVDGNGLMKLPARPSEIGWYRFGPRPGAPEGSAVLAGHIDSSEYGIGPLADLNKIEVGDRVTVTTSAEAVDFHVDRVQFQRRQHLSTATLFARTGPPRLVIITCGGPYDPERGYRDNLVVIARPVPG
jgi:sortase (surface protein transpeptidase)